MLDAALTFILSPISRLFDIRDPFNLMSLASALVCVLLVYALKPGRSALRRLRAFARAAFPRRILLHPSTLLDLKLFFITSLIYATGWIAALTSSEWIKEGVIAGLSTLAEPARGGAPDVTVTVLVTFAYFLVFEFNYWFAHWLMHRFEAMWAFHKLHHSAEVMTPMTEWRQHPVELLLFPACHAIGLGAFFGLASWALGPRASMFTLFETNIFLLVVTFTVLHLRHTHLWIPARGWLGCIIQSPAHHQIHHSTDPAHFGKNLGLCLSLWDWVFGTLYIPGERENLTLGVEGVHHEGVLQAYLEPFGGITRQAIMAQRSPSEALGPSKVAKSG